MPVQANLEHLRDNQRKALKLLASCHGFQGAEEYSGSGEAVGPPYFNNMVSKQQGAAPPFSIVFCVVLVVVWLCHRRRLALYRLFRLIFFGGEGGCICWSYLSLLPSM